MKLLLVNPPITILSYDVPPTLPPLGLMYIASMAQKRGHEVSIFDFVVNDSNSLPENLFDKKDNRKFLRYGATEEIFLKHVAAFNPDLIGLSNIMAVTEKDCLCLASLIKINYPNIPIIIGGTNCSARAKAILKNDDVDFVYRGEGDSTFIDFLDIFYQENERNKIPGICYKNNGVIQISQEIPILDDLDQNPIPAWDLIDVDNYLNKPFPFSFHIKPKTTTMISSRGCNGNCIFCSGRKYLGPWRRKSPENVIKEAEMLKKDYGVQEVQFLDSNMSFEKDGFIKLLELWKKNVKLLWAPIGGLCVKSIDKNIIPLMSESGCHSFPLGIEAGSLKTQKYIGKIVPVEKVFEICKEAKKYGIWVHGLFVIGFPEETEEDIYEILRYSKKADLDSISLFAASPLPGARLYNEFINDETFEPELSRIVGTHFALAAISQKKMIMLRKKISGEFFWWKIFRELKLDSIYTRLKSPQFKHMISFIIKAIKRFFYLKKRDKF